ncbi:sensor histidine kinase [Paeniroseomonas aquatica]|uniref:histidine kinase n=1 Tax=Paeniroseomonas aquatica TaxID=373043 RepID=A0ABT8A813_9PROT|nr:histidine kinase dimerization/phosphoacceptor domain -containing protein [Paeniroseomonas aquatica]MDN3565561.1 histidine kinase dimerization/phosphoacceptor domain -containing protein [Paeniroseomonas aquatica]
MTEDNGTASQVEALLATADLAGALDNERFRRFLDQVPIAIAVAEIPPAPAGAGGEHIVYANPEFEQVSGLAAKGLSGKPWTLLAGEEQDVPAPRSLGEAIPAGQDRIGTFRMNRPEGGPALVDAYANLIEDDEGVPAYRMAVLVDIGAHAPDLKQELADRLREKDLQLQEIQHRVKNNLQMIAALIRIEARNAQGGMDPAPFDRLAGRIEAIQILYGLLSDSDRDGSRAAAGQVSTIDLGSYLSDIASSVMRSHAVEGIRLDLKVDSYPVSVNVAMPTGLVVNELLTNALKHAFPGLGRERQGGTITLHSLSDGEGCRLTVADDGIGLPAGAEWPRRGKLSAMIVQSLRQNARASFTVESRPGEGTRVLIAFRRETAAAA